MTSEVVPSIAQYAGENPQPPEEHVRINRQSLEPVGIGRKQRAQRHARLFLDHSPVAAENRTERYSEPDVTYFLTVDEV